MMPDREKLIALASSKWVIAAAVVITAAVGVGYWLTRGPDEPPTPSRVLRAKRVDSGYKVDLEDDEQLVYAGIRTPHDNEPLHEEARERNEDLVVGKELRLRYDPSVLRDKDGRLTAYAFLPDRTFVNVVLVREGLAYARLRPENTRYSKGLLKAQKEARSAGRGIWKLPPPSPEKQYPADPNYAEFHRPNCEVVGRIKPERLTTLTNRIEAFDRGFAPCNKCLP